MASEANMLPPRFHSPVDDPTSPYHLHPSEGPRIVLVSQLLTGNNYTAWSRAFTVAITIKKNSVFLMAPSQHPQIHLLFSKMRGFGTTIWFFVGYTIQSRRIFKRVSSTPLQQRRFGKNSDLASFRVMDQDNINCVVIWPTSPKKMSPLLSITQR